LPTDDSISNSTLKDLFNNKTCRITTPITPVIQTTDAYFFWPLMHDIGLLTEYTDYDDQQTFSRFSLSLLELDWFDKEIQKGNTIEFEDQQHRFTYQQVISDSMDPKRFLLRNWHGDGSITLKLGRVQDSQLLLEADILTINRTFGFCSLIGNTLYSFNYWSFTNLNQARICITQLDQDAQISQIELELLPEQFTTIDNEHYIVGCFAMDRLYLAVQHNETKRYGIFWTSHETRNWEPINFEVKQQITSIEFFANEYLLLIQTNDYESDLTSDVHQVQNTFYRIPLKKPEKLSVLAWSSLVRSKSHLSPKIDPYEEARKYLPYNSDIRCPFEE